MYRTGIGFDSHRFAAGRRLVIGGVEVPFPKGLDGHSDADVLCHSIIDAILGAAGLGDIGRHFPDTDPTWKDAASTALLARVVALVRETGFAVEWIDATVIAEQPKLGPHFGAMTRALAAAGLPPGAVNLKAKTSERMGALGRGEGIAALAVCTLRRTS